MLKMIWHLICLRYYCWRMDASEEAKHDLLAHWDYYAKAQKHWEILEGMIGEFK